MAQSASRVPAAPSRCLDESFLDHCDDRIREFFEYWKGKCKGDRLPSRKDLDPAKIPHLLPNIMLVDVIPPKPTFRYRLVGTDEVRHRGFDPTGKTLDEAFSGIDAEYCDGNYRYVAETGKLLYDSSPEPTAMGYLADIEVLFMPLAGDGKKVDSIMVYSVTDTIRGDRLLTAARSREGNK